MQNHNEPLWLALWQRLGVRGDSREAFHDLVTRYSEPHRVYHTLEHIRHCLVEFERVRTLAANPNALELAIWFHDAIYDTQAKDNEEKSAAFAAMVASEAALPAHLIEQVSSLIMATKHVAAPSSPDEQLIVDIDLAILGQPEEAFDRYDRQIRKEYAWVPDGDFASGRSAILKSFLDRPAIYSTQYFHGLYEVNARQNLCRALAHYADTENKMKTPGHADE